MNVPKIVIHPEEVLDTVKDAIGESNLYVPASGIRSNNEVSDYRSHAECEVHYHYHDHGYELFTILSGSVMCMLGGKRAIARVGDMILVKPFTPHAFTYLENGTIWRENVVLLSLYENERNLGRVVMNCPEKLNDREFMTAFQADKGRKDYWDIPINNTDEADSHDLPGFCGKNDFYKSYSFPGIVCNLKYPKWDMGGVKEIWELVMDKGYTMKWDICHVPDQFIVVSGSVEVQVQGLETQIAKAGDTINIPAYYKHSIKSLQDGTVIDDFNCEADMLMFFEEWKLGDSSKHDDPDYIASLKKFHNCTVEWAGIEK